MTSYRPRTLLAATAAFVAAAAVTTGLVVTSGATADPSTTPPWQTAAAKDPHQVGTLSFYDASGNPITSGSTTTAPFAAYAVASNAVRSGDDHAVLYGYAANSEDVTTDPTPVVKVGDWSGAEITAASAYPAAGAPAGISATLPVAKGSSSDLKLSDLKADFPNTSSVTAYQGVYEIRMRTAKAGVSAPSSADYAVADIVITGNTWSLYGSGTVKTDTTTTATIPTTGTYGTGFDIPVTVTGAGVEPTSTVTLKDGTTSIGASEVLDSTGHATLHVGATALAAGTHTLHVLYNGDTAYNSSSSTSTVVTIAKAGSSVTPTVPTKATYGTSFHVSAHVAGPAGSTATGSASLKQGSTTLYTANLVGGTATFTVGGTKLGVGSHALTVSYAGSTSLNASSSTPKSVLVGKAVGHVANGLSPKSIKHTKKAKLTVTVTATGVTPTGTVTIYDGTKVIGKVSLTAAKKGKFTFTLPKLKKGSHKIHAVYGGSSTVGSAKGATVTLKST